MDSRLLLLMMMLLIEISECDDDVVDRKIRVWWWCWSKFLLFVEPNILDSRYYSVVIVTQEYCTLVPPALGFGGGAPKIFFWDVCWPIVLRTHGIGLTLEFSHCISPIKESIVKWLSNGIVLYQKRDCDSVKRKCSSFVAGCIPSSFWTIIKGLAISLWT